MPAEAAPGRTDPEYRTMARTRLAMPVTSTGLMRTRCRAALGPVGLHSYTCPGPNQAPPRCRGARSPEGVVALRPHGGQPA
eukprot:14673395-Alexandrium_andersonii.AAC.1